MNRPQQRNRRTHTNKGGATSRGNVASRRKKRKSSRPRGSILSALILELGALVGLVSLAYPGLIAELVQHIAAKRSEMRSGEPQETLPPVVHRADQAIRFRLTDLQTLSTHPAPAAGTKANAVDRVGPASQLGRYAPPPTSQKMGFWSQQMSAFPTAATAEPILPPALWTPHVEGNLY